MVAPKNESIDKAFRVPLTMHLFSGLVHGFPRLWTRLGNAESWMLRERLRSVSIERPVYVAGLARSGSTILLEFLSSHPDVVTHEYRDFPPVFTPYWWREIVRRAPKPAVARVERAHQDGLLVGPDSPEAMEEAIWMAFFPEAHNPEVSQVLDSATDAPQFERFYREHVLKLLLSRGGRRYVSKGNYNFTRLPYLLKLFPDARFVIPIRRPLNHIASLMKQQRLFTAGESRHPRASAHLRRVGHFEFGLNRRPINAGDDDVAAEVAELWRRGEEVRGWARYWAHLYGWLAERLERDAALRQAALVVRFEDLCADPRTTLESVLEHTRLDRGELPAEFAGRIEAPTYYSPAFSTEDESIIEEETRCVAARFGYLGSDIRPCVTQCTDCVVANAP